MDLLSPDSAEDWRRGRISYLERVIRCNLSKLVTLFLHVRRVVHLKKERSRLAILRRSRQHGSPARDEKFWKAKSKDHESRRKLHLPMKVAEKRCSAAASMRASSNGPMLGAA